MIDESRPPLALARKTDYLGGMVMIPPKPRVIWTDALSFFTRRERHSWIALVAAILIPGFIIGTFAWETETSIGPTDPVITYVQVWGSDRTDEQIIERQRVLALAENERRALRRHNMQRLAEQSGVDYDREAAAEADRITRENRENLSRPGDAAPGEPVTIAMERAAEER